MYRLLINNTKRVFRPLLSESFFLVLGFFLLLQHTKAQSIASYTFSQSNGTYTELSDPQIIAEATQQSGLWNNRYDTALPFTFKFNSIDYTSIKVHSYGFITFGNDAPFGYVPISSANNSSSGYEGAIAPLAGSISAYNFSANDKAGISYKVEGTAPNRKFIIQWKNYSYFYYNDLPSTLPANAFKLNFQIHLMESGQIQFVYDMKKTGTGTPSPSNFTAQIGIRGLDNTDYNNRQTSGSSATANLTTTTSGTTNSVTSGIYANYLPPSGLTYTWTPPAACTIPVAQPTALNLNNTGIIINGSFTAANPAPDKYLIVRHVSGTTPNLPQNGTIYPVGQNTSLNAYVSSFGTATTFENNYNHGIQGNTKYEFTVYAVNTNCNGGPFYRTQNPLTATITNCPLSVNSLTATAATNSIVLNWTAGQNGNALPYSTVIEVATDNSFTQQVTGSPFTVNSTTLTKTINGLQANTQYYFRAKNVSSQCESFYTNTANIYTACVAITDFNENFDSSGTFPNCWSKITTSSSTSTTPTINVTPTTEYVYSAPNGVTLYGNGADLNNLNNKLILVSPLLSNVNSGTHRLKFRAKKPSGSNSTHAIRVVALSSNTADAEIEVIATIPTTDITNTFKQFAVNFDNYTGTAAYVGIQRINGSSYSYLSLDDISWEPIPACSDLENLTAINPTINGATISWSVNGVTPANGYEYYISATNEIPSPNQTLLTTANNSITPSNLSASTTYYIFVRSVCSATEKGDWESTTFATINVAPVPWQEEFLTSAFPLGWSTESTNGFTLGTVRGVTGTGNSATSIYRNLYTASPTGSFSTIPVGPLNANNYELSFYYKQSNYNAPYAALANWGNFTVEISTDFGASWDILDTVSNEAGTGSYIQKTYSLSAYQGEYVKIRIKGTRTHGDFDLSFDNFEIKTNSSVIDVTSVTVNTENSVPAVINTQGGTLQLAALVNPADADQNVIWSLTEGNTFATLSDSGLITATANGSVTIRATSVADDTKFAELTVAISNQTNPDGFPSPYCNIDIEDSDADYIEPITFVSFANISNTTSAVVGATPVLENFTNLIGDVTKGQTYTLTVKGNTNGNYETNYIKVYIDWNLNHTFEANEMYDAGTLYGSNGTDGVETTHDILIPADAVTGTTRMRIVKDYEENNTSACNDLYFGQAEDYTLNIAEGQSPVAIQSVAVTVTDGAEALISAANGTLQLVATVNPADASQEVTWSVVSGNAFITVNTNGLVTAVANGTAVVRAVSVQDTTKYDDIEIIVAIETAPDIVQSVAVTVTDGGEALISAANGTLQLAATVNPADASQEVTWSIVSGDAFVTVNTNGLVTAVANGTAVVRAVSVQDTTKYDDIEIIVAIETAPVIVQSVAVTVTDGGEALISAANGTLQLAATVNPADASQEVTWSIVSGDAFVTVNTNGLVTAVANGTAVVRAVSVQDTTKYDDIEVIVAIDNIPEPVCEAVATFSETFEEFTAFPQNCWSASPVPVDGMVGLTDTANKAVQLYSYTYNAQDIYIVSPKVSTIDGQHVLSFDVLSHSSGTMLQIGTLANPTDFSGFTPAGDAFTPSIGNYTTTSIPAADGHEYVAIRFIPNGVHKSITIDNVEWKQQNLSTGEFEKPTVTIYPNPATDRVFISSEKAISTVRVFNQLGQLIKSQNSSEIDLSDVASGMLYLEIRFTDHSSIIEKVIKK